MRLFVAIDVPWAIAGRQVLALIRLPPVRNRAAGTVPYVHDVNPYVPTLATGATLVLVGFLGPLEAFNSAPLVYSREALAGSVIGGIAETQEMLDFCGQHGITSDIEVIRIQDINEADERLLKADVKYRFVIDMASLKG
jgi:uncharacterized zinc-type alcohol dehydrogenase-like protein